MKLIYQIMITIEKLNSKHNVSEGWSLGFGEPIPFSAVHGNGIDELYERIKKEVKRPIFNKNEEIEGNNFSKKSSSKNLKKLLESAIANAEHNNGLDIDNLFISEISVDDAFLLKRIRPRARGRADRIQKRSCHINLSLNTRGI